MSSEERVIDRKESLSKLAKEERRKRSPSPVSDEEEELDEFGRVKRRREKFKSERDMDDDRSDNEYSRSSRYSRRHHRRSPSGSRSPVRRSYRRRYSESDSDYDHRSASRHRSSSRRRSSSRPRSPSRHRHHSRRDHRHHYYRSGANPYTEAAQYIDTEFYPTKIYIGDLEDVTESEIDSTFSRFGPLESVRLVEGKDYGFITFVNKEDALAAIQSMHGALLGSRHIKVNRAKIPERNKVGFGNVPWQDEDGLMAREASLDYDRKKVEDNAYPVDPSITRRVLTSYDDL